MYSKQTILRNMHFFQRIDPSNIHEKMPYYKQTILVDFQKHFLMFLKAQKKLQSSHVSKLLKSIKDKTDKKFFM